MTYLLDTSAWAQATHSSAVAARLADHIRCGELALCTVTALEVLSSSRNATEYQRDLERLRGLPWRDLSDPKSAVDLQLLLAQRGWHRTPIPDVVIAATAAEHGLTRLAETAGISHEWLPERGTGHQRQARLYVGPTLARNLVNRESALRASRHLDSGSRRRYRDVVTQGI